MCFSWFMWLLVSFNFWNEIICFIYCDFVLGEFGWIKIFVGINGFVFLVIDYFELWNLYLLLFVGMMFKIRMYFFLGFKLFMLIWIMGNMCLFIKILII